MSWFVEEIVIAFFYDIVCYAIGFSTLKVFTLGKLPSKEGSGTKKEFVKIVGLVALVVFLFILILLFR